jgi:nucleoside-diphosphate-sugar epimerase
LYVDDAVSATLAAARAPRAGGRVINVGSGAMVTISEVRDILTNLLRTVSPPALPPNSEVERRQVYAQTTLAAELLDFTPRVPLVAGLARTIRSLNELEYAEAYAFARASLDD